MIVFKFCWQENPFKNSSSQFGEENNIPSVGDLEDFKFVDFPMDASIQGDDSLDEMFNPTLFGAKRSARSDYSVTAASSSETLVSTSIPQIADIMDPLQQLW